MPKDIGEPQGTLMQRTIALMQGKDLIRLSVDADVNYHWLKKFAKGQVDNPSVNRVQRLYEFLSGTKLELV